MKGNKLLKPFYMAIAVLLCVGTAGCRDKMNDIYKGGEGEPEKVPNDFDYSTSKNVQLTIHYDVPKGYRVYFEAYTKNPISLDSYKNFVKDEALTPFIEGWTNDNGEISYTAEIASMVDEIYVYSSNEGVPMLMKAAIIGDKVTLTSNESVVSDFSSRSSARAADDYYRNWQKQNCAYQYLGKYDAKGIPEYLLHDSEYSYIPTPTFNGIVNATRPDNSDMATFYNCSSITISERANVFINFISHNNSQRNNVLAYYVLNANKPAKKEINKNLIIAFPNTNADGLKTGDVVQLKYNDNGTLTDEFPAGSKIGFVLLVDAFNKGVINKNTHVMYAENSHNRWDIGNAQTADKPALISYLADDQIVLAFEDMPWNDQAGRKALPNFSDDIFVITSNPIKAMPTPEPGVDPEMPEYDMITRESGILGFEDNWPSKGDYDLNDVVVSYYRTFYRQGDMLQVIALDEKYAFLNNGATFANGFGYVIDPDVSVNAVKSSVVTSGYSCEGQGLDKELSDEATIMLFDDARKIAKGTTFEVRTVFNSPIFAYKGFNPFIVVSKEKGWLEQGRTEIHLPKYVPTPKGNTSLFGKEDDASISDKGLYYVREGNYPFAIKLTDATMSSNPLPNFVVPAESKAVDETYPKFKEWVESNGKNSQDWYLHPNK